MLLSRIVLASALVLPTAFASVFAQAPAGDVWTPHKLEKVRAVSSAAVSPDGARVALTIAVPRIAGQDEDGPAWVELHLLDNDAGGEARAYVGGKVNVSQVAWTPDGKQIAFVCKRGDDKQAALYVLAADGGEARKLVELKTAISAFSFAPDGKRVALVAPPFDEARKKAEDKGFKQQVYEEDVVASEVWIAQLTAGALEGTPRMLDVEGSVTQVQWSPTDARLAVSSSPSPLVDDEMMRQRVRVIDAEDGHTLAKIENPGKLGALAWSPDGQWIALLAAADVHDPSAGRLCVAPASGGVPRDVWPSDEQGDANAFAWQDATQLMYVEHRGVESLFGKIAVRAGTGGERKVLLSEGQLIITALSLSKDGKHAAFVAHTPQHPPELYTMSHGDNAPKRRTDSNPWAKGLRMAKQEVVRHKAQDGLELEGILVRPLDEVAGQRYPLILCVHGGPEAHESNGWMTNYSRPGQVAAARGMAVFYPNYRGSTGRGVAFSKLGQGDAAGKEFDDLIAAVDHLVEMGLVDAKKVGITGGSYGGYATAWCSTKYSERFAAGVMFVGISDKVAKFGSTDIPDEEFYVHALKRPWEDWEHLYERSPIRHAGNCKTPLLILHGKDDPRVDPGQSRMLYRHLKVRGQAPVRLVLYPGEGHGNRKACSRLDYNLRSLQWMEQYLKGSGGAAPAWPLDYADPEAKKDEKPEVPKGV